MSANWDRLSTVHVLVAAVVLCTGCVGFDLLSAGTPDDAGVSDGMLSDGMLSDADQGLPNLPLDQVIRIDELAPVFGDDDPTLTGDLLEMYFNRSDDGQLELYVTTRVAVDDLWGAPVPVTELNTALRETNPEVSVDGLTMYFSRSAGVAQPFLLMRATRATRGDT